MKTSRGFEVKYFKDSYGIDCSIQESSAIEPYIWLGVDNPELKVIWSDLPKVKGLETEPTLGSDLWSGWHKVILPKEIEIFSRMHINQEQAKFLIKELKYFVKYGCLKSEEK